MKNYSQDLTAMYRSFTAYLWVEDEETRAYLEALWRGESRIKIYVAGGNEYVRAVVRAAREAGASHVFGFCDRDFGVTNLQSWADPATHVFVGSAHEVENYLLDSAAIAACDVNSAQLNPAAIDAVIKALAGPLTWWMACRATIAEIRYAATNSFIEHPKRAQIVSLAQAENCIIQSTWWKSTLPTLQPMWAPGQLTNMITTKQQQYAAMLVNGDWIAEFSGKEIFSDLRSNVWTKRQQSNPAGRLEFVKAVGRQQLALNREPQELKNLRTEIRQRVGL